MHDDLSAPSTAAGAGVRSAAAESDAAKLRRYIVQRRAAQSLPLAVAGGVLATLIGAVLWGAITAITHYQIGWMAVGVGFLAGYAVRYLGKGIDRPFCYVGALCALGGCLLGNYFAAAAILAQEVHLSVPALITRLPLGKVALLLRDSFQPTDLLFYAIALYEGYRFSLRHITPEEYRGLGLTGAAGGG